jgi:hypothetical protein
MSFGSVAAKFEYRTSFITSTNMMQFPQPLSALKMLTHSTLSYIGLITYAFRSSIAVFFSKTDAHLLRRD